MLRDFGERVERVPAADFFRPQPGLGGRRGREEWAGEAKRVGGLELMDGSREEGRGERSQPLPPGAGGVHERGESRTRPGEWAGVSAKSPGWQEWMPTDGKDGFDVWSGDKGSPVPREKSPNGILFPGDGSPESPSAETGSPGSGADGFPDWAGVATCAVADELIGRNGLARGVDRCGLPRQEFHPMSAGKSR